MTDPTPLTVQPDPRPASRPEPAGGKAHWDALTTEAEATGGHDWKTIRDGYVRPNIRDAELLPVDVNSDLEQEAPGEVGNDAPAA